jgi:hypothetical protein
MRETTQGLEEPRCWRFLASPQKLHTRWQWKECLLALAIVATGFAPWVTGLGNIFSRTHDHRKVASARITVAALHLVVFGLSYLYFPKGGSTAKMIK